MAIRLIDIHPHIVSPDTHRYPVAPLGGERSGWSSERPVTFEQYIACMDEAGIDKAAIVHTPTTYGFDNAYVADAVASLPGRFDGVFCVDMVAPDAAQKIGFWACRGLGGLRLFTGGSTTPLQSGWLEDPRLLPGWEAATDLGIPICVQMAAKDVPHLVKLLDRYPRTKVVLDHMLRPPLAEGEPYPGAQALFDLARYKNLYLKMTSINTRQSQEGKATPQTFFGRLVRAFGAERMAWGSNFPASEGTLPEMVTDLRRCIGFLAQEEQHWIMAGTALNLYPRLNDQGPSINGA